MSSSDVIKAANAKEGSNLSYWDQSSASSSDLKSDKTKVWLQPPKTTPSLDSVKPSTSKGQQALIRKMSQSTANFGTSTISSNSSLGYINHFIIYIKQIFFQALCKLTNMTDYIGDNYILIREGIRFMQNGTPPVFVKCPRFETP